MINRKSIHHNRNHNINNNNNIINNNNNNNYSALDSKKENDFLTNSRCDKVSEGELNHNHPCHKNSDQMSFVVTMSTASPTANLSLNTNSNVNINVQSNHNFNSHNHSFNYSDDYVRKNDTDSGNSAMSSYDEGDN